MVGMVEAGVTDLGSLENIVDALEQILLGFKQILTVVASVIFTAPVLPVLAWALFWLFAVDWTRLRQIILKGGWLGVVLVGVVMVVVWQQIVPEAEVIDPTSRTMSFPVPRVTLVATSSVPPHVVPPPPPLSRMA